MADIAPTRPRPDNPLLRASFFSRLFFTWAYPLLHTGLQRPLQEQDLPHIDFIDSSAQGLALFTTFTSSSHSIYAALLRYYFYTLRWTQIKMALYVTSMVLQAVALGKFLQFLQSSSSSTIPNLYLWAAILITCAMVIILSTHSLYFDVWMIGMRLRLASIAAVFDKTLKLSSTCSLSIHVPRPSFSSSTPTTIGQIVNLASNDAERFVLASVFGLYLLWGPLHAVLVFIVGSLLLHSALPFVIGYIFLFFFALLQYIMSQKFVQYRGTIASITDQRVHWISQLLSGVRVMKMHAWEESMTHRLNAIRAKEVEEIQRATRLRAFNEAIFFVSSITICIIIFAVHQALGGTLTIGSVYSIFALMNTLQFTQVKYFSTAVMACSECWVSVRRIAAFLAFPAISNSDFLNPTCCNKEIPNVISSPLSVLSFKNVTCYWNRPGTSTDSSTDLPSLDTTNESIKNDPESSIVNGTVALSSINLDVFKGELCCIIGPVGSGKSALLQAVARELPILSGEMHSTYQKLSYAAQDPWIVNASARENILLGQKFDQNWYEQVICSCALDKDFELFSNGDATIIGDRGVQVSGGQRSRISLARALYRDSELLLLDDPLSAVDSKTGRWIYHMAIQGLAVKRGATVILATHQHQFVISEKCAAMENGRLVHVGSYSSCMDVYRELRGVDRPFNIQDTYNHKIANIHGNGPIQSMDGENMLPSKRRCDSIKEANNEVPPSDDHNEVREEGGVTLSTWRHYEKAIGGHFVTLLIACLMLLTQTALILTVVMTASWARQSESSQKPNFSRLKLVVILCLILILLSSIRAIVFFRYAISASKRLHDDMARNVLRATIMFFDTNPIGRILNRFSSDIGTTDDCLPMTLFDFIATFTMVVGGIVTAIIILPPVLLSLPILIFFFIRSRRVFVISSREIKRLEGLARSPIYDSISESLSGVASIRANDAVSYFRAKFEDAQNVHSRAYFAFIFSSRYLGVRIDCLMFIVITLSCFLAILLKETEWLHVDSITIGLALSMLLQMGDVAQWSTRQSAEVTNQMVSVERLLQYSTLPSEAPLRTKADLFIEDSCSHWPTHGVIEVCNLSVRYRPTLPLTLVNITFAIDAGAHIAVVGRTGSGKSTLVQSFLRLLEAEEGKILIDGIDIATLGLHRLRKGVTVINQTPTLYGSVTLRENLDPLGQCSEEDINQALSDVQMMEKINQLYEGLNTIVSESGSNFSVGQRQLLCLARAILWKSKILILDEPTANVDRETESHIQEAIRKRFQHATMISIAHRLDTIIDCDKVLVFGHGQLLEFGSPVELLERNGSFASLIDETGPEMARQLRIRACARNRTMCGNSL